MRIALSCGGNEGDVAKRILWAVDQLIENGLAEIQLSSFYITPPVGCKPGTPDFVNAALTGVWCGSVERLLALCKKLEVGAGRAADHPRYADRPLDLDIVFFGDRIIRTEQLTIPHPEASTRLFVLVPMAEIAGDWPFPGKECTVAELLSTFAGSPEYSRIMASKKSL